MADTTASELARVADAFVHVLASLGDRAVAARREPPHVAVAQMRAARAESDALQAVLLRMPRERFEPARDALYAVRETLRAAELAALRAIADARAAATSPRAA